MTTKNVNAFSPRMASVLMAMPREKGTKSAPACATVTEIAGNVGTRAAYTIDWLGDLGTLGLVQKLGKKEESTPESKWQLTANGRKVVGALTEAV